MKKEGGFGAYTALSAAVLFWGLSFVATKVALETFPTFTLIFARFSMGACLFLGLMIRRGRPHFSRKNSGMMLLTALCEPGLYFIFETIGLQHTTAPKAALIIATVPVAVMIFAALFIGERTPRASFFGIGISLAGIALLIAGDPQFRWTMRGQLRGDLLIFGAVVSAALYTVCVRTLVRDHSALEITSMQTIYGGIFYTPAFFLELPHLEWAALSGRSLGALLYLTLFATVGAFLCYNYALTRLPASRASVFINAIPVVTALGAWVVLGERLSPLQIGGGLMVLAGVFVANLPAQRSGGVRSEV